MAIIHLHLGISQKFCGAGSRSASADKWKRGEKEGEKGKERKRKDGNGGTERQKKLNTRAWSCVRAQATGRRINAFPALQRPPSSSSGGSSVGSSSAATAAAAVACSLPPSS